MRFAIGLIGYLTLFVGMGAAADPIDDCNAWEDPELTEVMIKGCTQLLERFEFDRTPADFAYNNRGMGYLKKGELDRATADLTKAVKINAKVAAYRQNRGWARFLNEDYRGAAEDFLRLIELTDNPEGMLQLFLSRARAGRIQCLN